MTDAQRVSNNSAIIDEGAGEHRSKGPWYRRRSVLVVLSLLVVVAAAVIIDLPSHVSHATEVSSDAAVINEVNTDVSTCAYALKEALAVYAAEADHTLTKSDARQVPGLLTQDQDACSFSDGSILDLSEIESPGSPSGKHLNQMISTVTTWATSDALAVIEAVQKIIEHPNEASARAGLRQSELLLASDRTAADDQLQAAEDAISGHLPDLSLTPVVPLSRS